MDGSEEQREIWFERWGAGPFISYMPSTAKGFAIWLAHILAGCLWMLPFALLAQFRLISDAWLMAGVIPGVVAVFGSMIRIMHRHSAPHR